MISAYGEAVLAAQRALAERARRAGEIDHPDLPGVTAHHEAGHAVAYVAMGHRFRYVTIRPRTPGLAGRVAVRPRRVDGFRQAITIYAGPEAEARYLASLGWDEDEVTAALLFGGGCVDDYQEARRALPNRDRSRHAEQFATELLGFYWPAVVTVAGHFINRRRGLTYPEVSALIGAALSGGTA